MRRASTAMSRTKARTSGTIARRGPTSSTSCAGKCSTATTSPRMAPAASTSAQPTRSSSKNSPSPSRTAARSTASVAPTSDSAAVASSMPSKATSGRPWCVRSARTRSARALPSRRAACSASPTARASAPIRLGSSFSSPRRPKTPTMRPALASVGGVAVGHVGVAGVLGFGLELILVVGDDVDRDAALGAGAHQRAQRLRDPAVATDDLAPIVLDDDQFDDGAPLGVDRLDQHLVGVRDELAGEEAEQVEGALLRDHRVGRLARAAVGSVGPLAPMTIAGGGRTVAFARRATTAWPFVLRLDVVAGRLVGTDPPRAQRRAPFLFRARLVVTEEAELVVERAHVSRPWPS